MTEDSVIVAEFDAVPPVPENSQRAHTRHTIPVTILLETFNEKGEVAHAENTVTENISRKGATVYSSFDAPVGRFLRLTSSEYSLAVFAVVRGRSKGPGGMPRLHVEFMDREWPVD
jgi:hypothetical protein